MRSGKSWLQFSIRKLFALVALVALGVWWFSLPSRNAARFVGAINEGNLDVAATMFVDATENLMLTEWQPVIDTTASVESPTLDQWIYGRRRITMTVTYQGRGKPIRGHFRLEASRAGIHAPNFKRKKAAFHQERQPWGRQIAVATRSVRRNQPAVDHL